MDVPPEEQLLAELEMEKRPTAASDQVVLAAWDTLNDPMVSEPEKNLASLLAVATMIGEHMQSDKFKQSCLRWGEVQRPLMEALKFPGAAVDVYTHENDGMGGAFLKFSSPPYLVKIDAEDASSLTELRGREYLTVVIYRELEHAEDPEDRLVCLVDGCVRNIREAERVCRLLESKSEEAACAIIKNYSQILSKEGE